MKYVTTIVAAGMLSTAILAGCSGGGNSVLPASSAQLPTPTATATATATPTPTATPTATPSSAPTASPTPTPIQLVAGTTVGAATFPEGDTATGGQGQQIDGINCRSFLNNQFHHHVHLSMFVNGLQIALPRGTGMLNPGTNNFIYHASCYYFLHTHDATGIIHMEPPISEAFTLRQYFDIWGQPLSANGFAGFSGPVAVYINGTLMSGLDPNTVPFTPFEEITLVIGAPPAWIPAYVFPAGYP